MSASPDLPVCTNHRAILAAGTPLIDLRAPAEFARGSVPGAVNLPLLTDEERAQVGMRYKAAGQAAAVSLGSTLVSGQVREIRINAWTAALQSHPDSLLYCWRGGLRSETVQRWLAERGHVVPRVSGGFKALRHTCLDVISGFCTPTIVLGGRTGSGKTRLLLQLPAAVDLEGLANHRGSAFGATFTPQPNPVDFENALAVTLMRHDGHTRVVFEDESRTIGRLGIPGPLHDHLQRAPLVVLDVPREQRAALIQDDYISAPLAAGIPVDALRRQFLDAADRIKRRLGGVRHDTVTRAMRDAFARHDNGDDSGHRVWITQLLTWYYDPMYDYQLERKRERVVFRGDSDAVRDYLTSA